jgi:hypothetical protein
MLLGGMRNNHATTAAGNDDMMHEALTTQRQRVLANGDKREAKTEETPKEEKETKVS